MSKEINGMQKESVPGRYRLAIGLTILAGIALRLGHLIFIDLDVPFRLGGLFLEFSNQIIKDHFALPITIPYYSQNGLPFAYPPLSFYVQALLINLFHPPKFLTVNLLPPLVATLGVPSFYYLLRQFTADRLEIWCMLAAFAFIPNTFLDQIEAAGLPEAFGELALIWYAVLLVRVYKSPGWSTALTAGILLGINILSSPGSAVAAPVLSLVFVLALILQAIRQRSIKSLGVPFIIAMAGLLVSAPYWLTVVNHHGPGIFIGSLSHQFDSGQRPTFFQQALDRLLTLDFSSIRNNSFLWSALTFLGMLSYLAGPGFHLPILFILFSLLPREGIWLSAMLAAFLAGRGLHLLAESFQDSLQVRRWIEWILAGVFVVAAVYGAILAVKALVNDRQWALEPAQVAALEEYAGVIPPDADVIAVGNDAFLEWAPQLLQREVVNTPYGLEWQPGELARVDRFNRELEAAVTFDDVMVSIRERLRLQEAWLVTDSTSRFAKMAGLSTPQAGSVVQVGVGGDLYIYHLVIK